MQSLQRVGTQRVKLRNRIPAHVSLSTYPVVPEEFFECSSDGDLIHMQARPVRPAHIRGPVKGVDEIDGTADFESSAVRVLLQLLQQNGHTVRCVLNPADSVFYNVRKCITSCCLFSQTPRILFRRSQLQMDQNVMRNELLASLSSILSNIHLVSGALQRSALETVAATWQNLKENPFDLLSIRKRPSRAAS